MLYDENEIYDVYNALVELTGHDCFAEKDLEIYYGDDYDQHVTDDMVSQLSDETGLQVWYVRNILLDEIPEVRAINGKFTHKINGIWKEFANVE